MPHDYDFQDDAHLAKIGLDASDFEIQLIDEPKTIEMLIGHFFWLVILVAIIGFSIGGFLVKKGIL